MTRKKTPARPASLIPFDPVATLNELVELLHHLKYLSVPFESSVFNCRKTVKYSTIPENELRRRLTGCEHVEIDLFDPPLRLRWKSEQSREVEILNDSDVPEANGLRFVAASQTLEPAADCILASGGALWPSTTLVAYNTEEFFEDALAGDGWDAFLSDRRHSWILAYQHAERLEVRLNGGNPEYLDFAPPWMDAVNELYATFRKVIDRWKSRQWKPPRWLSSRTAKPPMTGKELAQLERELTRFGSAFSLMRDLIEGHFIDDPRAIELGLLLLLPLEYMGTLNKAVAQSWEFPDRCHFVERERTEDEKAIRFYAQCKTFARCDRCGFSFASPIIDADELPQVFCGCGTKQARMGTLPDGLDHVERCIWRHLQEPQEGNFIPVRQIAESARCSQQTVWRKLKTLGRKVPNFLSRVDSKRGHGGGLGLKETDDPKTC